MAVVKNLMVRAGADFSGLTKGMSAMKKSINDVQGSISKSMSAIKTVVASAIAVGVGRAIKSCVDDAMQFEASIQIIDRIMGQSSQQFKNWANTTALSFNMSKKEAMQYGSIYGNLIAGFSKSTGETVKYTEDLLKASAVVASGTGRTMEDVMERIRSGLLGNTEAIEDLGIYAQVGMIKSTEAFKKFANGKSWEQLSYQTQQQIRLYSILEQVNERFGTELTQNTASAQQKFIAQLNNIKLALGQAFLPIYQTILPALTSLASSIANALNVVGQFMSSLFGIKQQQQAVASTQAQAAAVSGVGDAYQQAGKDAKSALAGFDQINALTDKKSSGTEAAIAPAVALPPTTAAPGDATNGANNQIQSMIGNLKSIMEPAAAAFDRLKTAMQPVIDNIKGGLKWGYDNVLKPLGQWVIGQALPASLDVLSGAFDVLNTVIELFKPLGQWLWDNFLAPIAAWTGGVIVDTLNWLGKALTDISNWIINNKSWLEDLAIAVGARVLAFTAWNVIMNIFYFTVGLVSLAVKGFGIALTFIEKHPILIALTALIAVIALLVTHWDDVKKVAASVWEGIKTTWNGVATWFDTYVVKPVVKFFSGLWNSVKTAAINAWTGVSKTWTTVSSWFNTKVIIPIRTFFDNMFSSVGNFAVRAWGDIVSVFKGLGTWFDNNVCKPVGDFFKGVINVFIDGLNWMIRQLNKISIDVPNWVADLLGMARGSKFGFTIAEVPRLANGGITNGPMLAMIGDNPGGREVVSPLDDLQGMIRNAVNSAMTESGKGSDRPINVVLKIGETEFGRVAIKSINNVQRQAGMTLLTV